MKNADLIGHANYSKFPRFTSMIDCHFLRKYQLVNSFEYGIGTRRKYGLKYTYDFLVAPTVLDAVQQEQEIEEANYLESKHREVRKWYREHKELLQTYD